MKDSLTRLGQDSTLVNAPDLVTRFEEFVRENGSHVIYVRINKEMNHECWDPVRQQANGLNVCPICYGTGHPISIERNLCRAWREAPAGRESEAMTQTWPGIQVVGYRSFAFLPKVRPAIQDIILEIEWMPDGRVRNLIMAYEIKNVEALREEQGIIVYYKCYGAYASVNNLTIEKLLRKETRIRLVD